MSDSWAKIKASRRSSANGQPATCAPSPVCREHTDDESDMSNVEDITPRKPGPRFVFNTPREATANSMSPRVSPASLPVPTSEPQKAKGELHFPAKLVSNVLSEEEISERIRKFNYPIPFPIFSALWPSDELVLIGGGGGRAGTGISSGLVVCKIVKGEIEKKAPLYNNGYSVKPCGELNSQDRLMYQMALHPSRKEFVGAIGGRIYGFTIEDAKVTSANFAQTDFHSDISEQFTSCLRFNAAGDRIVTGGEDKAVRLWSYPSLQLSRTLGSHSGPLNAVDFNKDGTRVVSASGFSMRIWATDKGSTSKDVSGNDALVYEFVHANNEVMEFRSCRWAVDEGGRECIIAILNASPRGPSYLGKFDATKFACVKLVKVDSNPLGTMEVSPERDFVATANNEGTLWVYEISTMERVNKQTKVHDLPCTSVAWAPDGSMVCSASADKSVAFVPKLGGADPSKWLVLLALIIFFFVLLFLF